MQIRRAASCLIEPGLECVVLEFPGPIIPAKKNKLRPRVGGGLVYDKKLRGELGALLAIAQIQWGSRNPVVHPRVEYSLQYTNDGQDMDGIYTTLIDVLKKAKVIVDDSIKYFNGGVIFHQATPAESMLATIALVFPAGTAGR